MRLRYLAAILFGIVGCGPSFAGDSITNKAQGSTGWSMDFGLDATTSNIRPLAILVDPTTGLLVPPFQAGNSIGNTSFIATQTTAANFNALVAQGAPASSAPWIFTPWIGGAVNAVGNPLFVSPGTGATWAVTGTFWQTTQPVSIASMPSTPVTGTFWQATQPVSGTFWQATQPVSLASLPALATGTNTIGKIELLGNAGGIMDAAGQNAASPASELLIGAQFNTTPTTLTSGNMSPLQMDSAGNLLVNVKAGGGSGGTSSSFSATFPGTGTAAGAEYLSSPPTLTTGQMVAFQTDVNGNLKVNVAAGGAAGGTSSSFAATFPATGTAAGLEYLSSAPTLTTGQMGAFQGDINGNLKVSIAAGSIANTTFAATQATAANLNATVVQGAAASSGPWIMTPWIAGAVNAVGNPLFMSPGTGATWAVTESGSWTVTANAGTNLNTSLLALESGGNLATIAGAITSSIEQTNEKQINGVVPLMGNGVSGTGSQRVNIASDNTAFSVNAIESGAWNITNITGTVSLPTGAATSANQPTNAAQGSTTAAQTGTLMEGAVTTSAPSYTTAQTSPFSLDTAGNLRVNVTTGGVSGNVSQGSTTSGNTGPMIQGAVTTAAPTYTTAQTNPISLSTAGSVRSDITQWGDTTLGVATAWGTAPSGNVPGVNANIVAGGIQGYAAGATFSGSNGVMEGGEVTGGSLWQPFQLDSSTFYLQVDCKAGCSSSTSITSWAGGTLGAMANYGTSPGAVLVPGVNAFVTNSPGVFLQPLANGATGTIAPVVSGSLEASHTYKSGAGALYSAYVSSTTGAAGYFVCIAATSISAGPITPVVAPIAIGPGPTTVGINFSPGPIPNFATGLTCAVTVSSTPYTYTAGGSVFSYGGMVN